MKIKWLIIVLSALTVLFFLPAASFSQVNPGQEGKGQTAVPDSLQRKKETPGIARDTSRSIPSVQPAHFANAEEEFVYNNFITRSFFKQFATENLRNTLVRWGADLPKPLDGFYLLVIDTSFSYPIIFLIFALILGLISNVLFVIGILFLSNRIMNYRARKIKHLRSIFEKIVTDLMLQVIDLDEAVRFLSKPKLKKHRNLLIEVLMDFQKSFRGDSDRQIIELYQELDLVRASYQKTLALSFYQKVLGIRELANMHPHYATEMIEARINDPNDIVRTEAQIAYPHVNLEAPFDFLSILKTPFSRWAQLNIYYFIKIHEMPVPSFDKWLNSDHQNVVNFSILMIALFQQQENAPEILHLLHSPYEATRCEAIRACGELHILECRQELKDRFQEESLRNRIEILKVFNKIGDAGDFQFLESVLKTDEISLRLEACRTMVEIGSEGINRLSYADEAMNFALTPYIAHVRDPRN